MASMTLLDISFVDPKGKTVLVDEVELTIGSKTSKRTKAPFRFNLDAAGAGKISFKKAKHFPYEFPVEVVDASTHFALKFHADGVDKPKMASLVTMAPGSAAKGVGSNHLTFHLSDLKESVFVACYDYDGGTDMGAFAHTRMHDARTAAADSDVFSVFDCRTGMLAHWVKGRGKEKLSSHKWKSGWCRMSETLQGSTAPVLVKKGGDPGVGAFSIVHLYDYIIGIGKTRPKTIVEFGMFGHAWAGGPILYNTSERPEYKAGAKKSERDPLDHDARAGKDFNSKNMPERANFKEAFAPNAFVKMWGCLAVTVYRDALNRARRAKNDTEKLGVDPSVLTSRWDGNTKFNDNRPGIIKMLKESAYRANYMFILSKVIGQPVWGGGPGTGSDYVNRGAWHWQYVPEYQLKYRRGKLTKTKGYNFRQELHYMRDTLGWTVSPDWYVKFE